MCTRTRRLDKWSRHNPESIFMAFAQFFIGNFNRRWRHEPSDSRFGHQLHFGWIYAKWEPFQSGISMIDEHTNPETLINDLDTNRNWFQTTFIRDFNGRLRCKLEEISFFNIWKVFYAFLHWFVCTELLHQEDCCSITVHFYHIRIECRQSIQDTYIIELAR